jgi:hypothetical protein
LLLLLLLLLLLPSLTHSFPHFRLSIHLADPNSFVGSGVPQPLFQTLVLF